MDAVSLLGDVETAAARFHAAKAELEREREALYATVRRAAAEGIPAARIARSAGLSRERVRQIVLQPDST